MLIELSPEQQEAKDKALQWLASSKEPIHRIFGYACTGKTTIIKSITDEIDGRIVFGAYTGKAALVMRRKGTPARTIHSLVYKPVMPDREEVKELNERLGKEKEPSKQIAITLVGQRRIK